MLHKIKSVHILSKYILTIEFAEGVTKTYDMTKLIQENSLFKELKDEKLFYDVKVDVGGCGIIWNDAIDVSCDELFANGKEGWYSIWVCGPKTFVKNLSKKLYKHKKI